jgi:Pentapeptide repeats (8 copies)
MKESIQPFRKNWISISIVVTILCFLIVFVVVRPQQHNIYELDRKIEVVNEKIEHIKSIEEKITLEKDILIIEKDKVIINNGMYAALLQALGPMVLGITAYVGYLNFTIGEKNLKVTEDKQVTERFSKAIEHLGSDKIDIRLGGIYTLEKIVISSPEYHWTIVEILSAFIREKCQIERSMINSNNSETGEIITTEENPFSINSQNSSNQIKKIAVDIQAAITVLGRRNVDLEDSEEQYINLMEVNLAGVNMNNSNFSHANFIGSDLSGATLWNARLISCHLDRANLYQARLTYADLSKASLSGYPDANRTIFIIH